MEMSHDNNNIKSITKERPAKENNQYHKQKTLIKENNKSNQIKQMDNAIIESY